MTSGKTRLRSQAHKKQAGLSPAIIAALGVVYGDIGTSPLYALKECFDPFYGIPFNAENIYGLLSLVFWALTLVVTVKYLIFILRADNKGEGGIMALLALVLPTFKDEKKKHLQTIITFSGIIGAALLYGDGVITPAISVLSAVEGLEIATPAFKPIVVPLTAMILFFLFSIQKKGTASVAAVFGPLTLVWFMTIALTGIPPILSHPEILYAVNPLYGFKFLLNHSPNSFFVLGAVVLCITGAEALYADMGHFGKKPIRYGWFAVVFPALIINYFGQGALILARGEEVLKNPFYNLVSGFALYPLVMIATVATIIASQALISGAYSLTQQALQLGYLPRIAITHTSRSTEGQIYVPRINTLLMIACILLVFLFKDSSSLAGAYGVAVTGTMLVTSVLFYFVTRNLWGWGLIPSIALTGLFISVDFAFFASSVTKIYKGGWIPLFIAFSIFILMTTWKRGRIVLSNSLKELAVPLDDFLKEVAAKKPYRIRGTAVFMTLTRDIAPSVLLHHFKHNQVLHECVILLSVMTENEPEVEATRRVRVTGLSEGFYKVTAKYGYMENPDISETLALCEGAGLKIDYSHISFYLGRETFLTNGFSGMPHWRKKLFVLLSRNARPASEFFSIPPDQVIEIGSQIRI